MDTILRPYGVLLTDTTAKYVNLRKYGTPTDFAVAADWTPAAGDVKISKDGGAAANIGTLPAYVTDKGWKFILSAAELTAQNVVVRVADAATKVVCDYVFYVETLADPSAMWPDPDASNPVAASIEQIQGSTAAADNLSDDYDGTGYAKSTSTTGLTAAERSAVADAIWDEAASGHVATGTMGALNQLTAGTAQGAGASSITLAASSSATNDIYNGRIIYITSGVGSGQIRVISDYDGSTKVATVSSAWTTQPTSASEYVVLGN